MNTIELKSAYEAAYHKPATDIFFSPGRVNLIGEHTDYNGGFVFPCALSFGTYLLLAPNTEKKINFRSLNVETVYSLKLTHLTTPLPDKAWANYPLGVLAQFIKRGVAIEQGYDMLFWGNVPAGTTSIAALLLSPAPAGTLPQNNISYPCSIATPRLMNCAKTPSG